MNQQDFKILNLPEDLLNNLYSLDLKYMTPIQEKSLPYILEKKDVIAKAKTGSGKTVSFALGIINNLDSSRFRIQAMVIVPTRELANQVATTLKQLLRYKQNIKILTLTGGVPYKPQVHSLKHLAHIIVATPGRVLKHLENNNFSCKDINTLVLDEADRMLDMGFYDDIEAILSYIPTNRQTLLFSATYPQNLEELSKSMLNKPIKIEVESVHTTDTITQEFYRCEENEKNELLTKCFDNRFENAIVFCNTKVACEDVADYLESNFDCEVLVLHSDYDQLYRDETIVLFANKSYPILITTDLAARGLDIDDVQLVVNYDLPFKSEIYTHRIGRTARAGNKGYSISFIDNLDDFYSLEDYLDKEIKLLDTVDLRKKEFKPCTYKYSTLYINGGKKQKLRAGDILGALTSCVKLHKDSVGKIDIFPTHSYVAIKTEDYEKAYNGLTNNKIKNRYFKIYKR